MASLLNDEDFLGSSVKMVHFGQEGNFITDARFIDAEIIDLGCIIEDDTDDENLVAGNEMDADNNTDYQFLSVKVVDCVKFPKDEHKDKVDQTNIIKHDDNDIIIIEDDSEIVNAQVSDLTQKNINMDSKCTTHDKELTFAVEEQKQGVKFDLKKNKGLVGMKVKMLPEDKPKENTAQNTTENNIKHKKTKTKVNPKNILNKSKIKLGKEPKQRTSFEKAYTDFVVYKRNKDNKNVWSTQNISPLAIFENIKKLSKPNISSDLNQEGIPLNTANNLNNNIEKKLQQLHMGLIPEPTQSLTNETLKYSQNTIKVTKTQLKPKCQGPPKRQKELKPQKEKKPRKVKGKSNVPANNSIENNIIAIGPQDLNEANNKSVSMDQNVDAVAIGIKSFPTPNNFTKIVLKKLKNYESNVNLNNSQAQLFKHKKEMSNDYYNRGVRKKSFLEELAKTEPIFNKVKDSYMQNNLFGSATTPLRNSNGSPKSVKINPVNVAPYKMVNDKTISPTVTNIPQKANEVSKDNVNKVAPFNNNFNTSLEEQINVNPLSESSTKNNVQIPVYISERAKLHQLKNLANLHNPDLRAVIRPTQKRPAYMPQVAPPNINTQMPRFPQPPPYMHNNSKPTFPNMYQPNGYMHYNRPPGLLGPLFNDVRQVLPRYDPRAYNMQNQSYFNNMTYIPPPFLPLPPPPPPPPPPCYPTMIPQNPFVKNNAPVNGHGNNHSLTGVKDTGFIKEIKITNHSENSQKLKEETQNESTTALTKTDMLKELDSSLFLEEPENNLKRPREFKNAEEKNVNRPCPLSKKKKFDPRWTPDENPQGNKVKLPSQGYSPPILPIPTYQNILSQQGPASNVFETNYSKSKIPQIKNKPKTTKANRLDNDLPELKKTLISLLEYKKRRTSMDTHK